MANIYVYCLKESIDSEFEEIRQRLQGLNVIPCMNTKRISSGDIVICLMTERDNYSEGFINGVTELFMNGVRVIPVIDDVLSYTGDKGAVINSTLGYIWCREHFFYAHDVCEALRDENLNLLDYLVGDEPVQRTENKVSTGLLNKRVIRQKSEMMNTIKLMNILAAIAIFNATFALISGVLLVIMAINRDAFHNMNEVAGLLVLGILGTSCYTNFMGCPIVMLVCNATRKSNLTRYGENYGNIKLKKRNRKLLVLYILFLLELLAMLPINMLISRGEL